MHFWGCWQIRGVLIRCSSTCRSRSSKVVKRLESRKRRSQANVIRLEILTTTTCPAVRRQMSPQLYIQFTPNPVSGHVAGHLERQVEKVSRTLKFFTVWLSKDFKKISSLRIFETAKQKFPKKKAKALLKIIGPKASEEKLKKSFWCKVQKSFEKNAKKFRKKMTKAF